MQPKDPLAGISEIPAESGMQPGSLNEELTMKLQTWSRVRRTSPAWVQSHGLRSGFQ